MTKTRTVLTLVLVTAAAGVVAVCWIVGITNAASNSPVSVVAPVERPDHHNGPVHYDVLAQLLAEDRRSQQGHDWLLELARDESTCRIPTQHHPLLNRSAPDFTLHDHLERGWNLRAHLEQGPVVLVFYLGNTCPACLHQLFEINADMDRFHSLGAEVVAISGDAPALSRRRMEEFGAFAFPVLGDPGRRVARAFGSLGQASAEESETPVHAIFLLSRDGRVVWVQSGPTPLRNNRALLCELARLENKLSVAALKSE